MRAHRIAGVLADRLDAMPDGTRTTTFGLVKSVYGLRSRMLPSRDLFEIDGLLREGARERGVLLCTPAEFSGVPSGLPYHVPFVVRHLPDV